jgi:hypothetical protein
MESNTQEKLRSNNLTISLTLLDVNDNSPQFFPTNQYEFNINETSSVGNEIGLVLANDTDLQANSAVVYQIVSADNNGADHFKVTTSTA